MPIFVFGGGGGGSATDSPVKYTPKVISANSTLLSKNLLNPNDTTNSISILKGEVVYTLDGTSLKYGTGISVKDYILCSYNDEIGWIAVVSYA